MNNYFYLDHHNQQQGPISPERFAENGVTPNTLVWYTQYFGVVYGNGRLGSGLHGA